MKLTLRSRAFVLQPRKRELLPELMEPKLLLRPLMDPSLPIQMPVLNVLGQFKTCFGSDVPQGMKRIRPT